MLEMLKEYRNQNVHASETSDRAKAYAFHIQNYIRYLLDFHINSAGLFNSLDEANQLLDMPNDPQLLSRRREIIDMAIKYYTPKANPNAQSQQGL